MTKDGSLRPRVVLTTTASVDGRVSTSRSERLLEPAAGARWKAGWPADVEDLIGQRQRWIEEHYSPTAVLEGSGTFVAHDAVSPWADDDAPDPGQELFVDHLPRRAPRFFVVVDSRGRIDWQFTGDDETALIVLVCRATPSGYLRHLRQLGWVTSWSASTGSICTRPWPGSARHSMRARSLPTEVAVSTVLCCATA